jgi:type IV pilus assembly protein PilQ
MFKKSRVVIGFCVLLFASVAFSTENKLTPSPYTGEVISLNFQDIEIRAVLQVIAEFAGFNLITSDTVAGNVTLRLMNVPWDQALDIVLKSKNLDKRIVGNVLLVGPQEEIALREKKELETKKQIEELGPLHSQLMQIRYAKAEELAGILKEKANSLMTSRGSVTVDKRTNHLLVQDTEDKLGEVRTLIDKLDVPVRQVEISTQIIDADESCEETLGIRFAAAGQLTTDRPLLKDKEGFFSDLLGTNLNSGAQIPAKAGFMLGSLPNGLLLDLELQALEYEAKSRTIARPKLLTTDQTKASVEQGVEIPYVEATPTGASSITFRKAVLKLEVIPHITPDNKVFLDLLITEDTPGAPVVLSGSVVPAIKANRLQTKVLVNNGETVVLGGIMSVVEKKNKGKIPFLGNMPVLGTLFRNRYQSNERKELLIFITPKIVETPLKSS